MTDCLANEMRTDDEGDATREHWIDDNSRLWKDIGWLKILTRLFISCVEKTDQRSIFLNGRYIGGA